MLTHSLTLPLAVAASLLASSASAHPGHHNQVRHHHAHAHAHAHAKRAFVPVREALNARAVKGAGRMQRKVRRAAQGAVLLAADSNSTSSSSSASTAKYSSTAIWWKEAGWVGSCGVTINEDDMVVALPLSVYPDVSTASPLCGSSVSVTSPSTGKSVVAIVVGASDRQDYTTFSKAAYVALEGNLDVGELPIEFVVDSSKVPASSAATAETTAKNAKIANVNVQQTSSDSAQAPSTTAPPKAQAVKTTAAPSPSASSSAEESGDDWVCDSTETAESVTVTSKAAAPTADAAAAAASSKAAADAAWAASSSSSKAAADAAWAASSSSSAAAAAASSKAAAAASSKAAADAAWAASSSSSAAAAAASSKAAAAAAAAQPATTKVADTSSGSNLSLLSKAGVKGFLGTNTNAILSWYHTNAASDSTNGNSWCGFPYDDSVPGVAPSLKTMLNNFGGDYQAAATAYCGLEMVVTTPDGKSATLYIADAFDDTWVRTPSSLDIIYGSFAKLFGSQTDNKNDVVQGASWKFTGNRNSKYAFKSTTSLS
ncbi:hypothetical protein JCM10296v2_004361 [Rhodotorula toruloides]